MPSAACGGPAEASVRRWRPGNSKPTGKLLLAAAELALAILLSMTSVSDECSDLVVAPEPEEAAELGLPTVVAAGLGCKGLGTGGPRGQSSAGRRPSPDDASGQGRNTGLLLLRLGRARDGDLERSRISWHRGDRRPLGAACSGSAAAAARLRLMQ